MVSANRKVEPIWMAGGGMREMKGLTQTLMEADAWRMLRRQRVRRNEENLSEGTIAAASADKEQDLPTRWAMH
jgi:hypothetical protein